MIANILSGANSASIAIQAFAQDEAERFPPLTHPASVVFSRSPLSREALKSKLGDIRVPGIVTGLGFESMAPLAPTGTDWVNLRENSSSIISTSLPGVVGSRNGRPVFKAKLTLTALVADPADIRAAITKGVVATIPVWEVEYGSYAQTQLEPGTTTSAPAVRLGAIPGRLPRDHVLRVYASPGGTVYHEYGMTATKHAAEVTATYRPFSEL